MISTDTRSHAPSTEVSHVLARVQEAWQSLGQDARCAFGQSGGEAQPEARTCGLARILAEVDNLRFKVELAACPLGILCRDFVVSQLGAIDVPDRFR